MGFPTSLVIFERISRAIVLFLLNFGFRKSICKKKAVSILKSKNRFFLKKGHLNLRLWAVKFLVLRTIRNSKRATRWPRRCN